MSTFTLNFLVTGAMLVVRWILNEEDINENETFSELDRIAQMVKENLHGSNSSTHTALLIPLEEQMTQSNEGLTSVTHPAACLRILACLKQVLYHQLQFKGCVDEYYKKENSMLFQV